ncbi:hypothetical protein FS837_012694 [Tulasnella sp. UAMH 9824]|nr:hypothetical protein FS837_012694 [Tulasnella sp. UAMH 9824]
MHMDSLPTELLSLIFINVLPSYLDDAHYYLFDDPAPLQALISCVCQQWNRIAKSTPGLWTFIGVSNKARSHDAMKRRLELSGSSPLNVYIRLSRTKDEEDYWDDFAGSDDDEEWNKALEWADAKDSYYETHALLVKQVSRWNTLRVEAVVGVPSELRRWIPSQLPNVVGLSLGSIAHHLASESQKKPFISAPRLNFCASDSPIPNAADLQVELDVDSLFDGDPRFREAETWELVRDPEVISARREWWQWVLQNTSKVSWVVPSDSGEGEGDSKRLGGADLSFDDAIAYLDQRRSIWLKT